MTRPPMQKRSRCAWFIAASLLLLSWLPRSHEGFLSGRHFAIPRWSGASSSVSLLNGADYAEELRIGQEVSGSVKGFDKFGAILDLGLSLPGFIHKSKVHGTKRVENIGDELSIGDRVTARIMAIRRNNERRRRAEIEVSKVDVPEFDQRDIEIDASVGQVLTGTITRFNKVGAILDLGLSVRGFLHRKQISGVPPVSAEDVYSVGDKVTAQITEIRETARRGRPPEVLVSVKSLTESATESETQEVKVDVQAGQGVTGAVSGFDNGGATAN
eukprot:TRINITY_DN6415_c0_g1_i1.p1 TRINITY_DN6415_c0_g1~~TRINITY_DN6415_c0_g1_i1.p1  ORF type:complete len:272 (+),score=42.53 TRINITY_DN6415_c0_g1_i1:134-949(+)